MKSSYNETAVFRALATVLQTSDCIHQVRLDLVTFQIFCSLGKIRFRNIPNISSNLGSKYVALSCLIDDTSFDQFNLRGASILI